MAFITTRQSLGIGIATLALLGGAAGGVATASTSDTAGTARAATVHTGSGDVSTAAGKSCSYTEIGWYCGYYKGSKTVGYGSKGRAVKEVQALINETTDYKPKLSVDGHFGSKTKKAVIWFQKQYDVKPYDGIVGPKTWKEFRLK
ncbi:peptidoglycan-binding domain-containing protein [Streptomyces poonensis]|uniref:Peptidoglycan binding-like domain-containing protein n=1 Tax=Streptomyces poonensis TaxID=68255 RepID=A0A918PNM9_9ACTN|nr:peptidoglycan-binding protein [Streptomyces poonensis]GGZ17513.1 hypothetical protein GCM10010365_41670 [Streptomyces poonensis]GLJ90949.1 hypothetical protein GCM10017589_35550 [Streptomyces poonensis]